MRRLLLLTALGLGASVAQADNGSFYLGAGVTSSKLNDIAVQGTDFPDIHSTSWKVFAGFRPISAFAVEADYFDLGSETVEGACTFCCMEACRGLFQSDAQAFAAYARLSADSGTILGCLRQGWVSPLEAEYQRERVGHL